MYPYRPPDVDQNNPENERCDSPEPGSIVEMTIMPRPYSELETHYSEIPLSNINPEEPAPPSIYYEATRVTEGWEAAQWKPEPAFEHKENNEQKENLDEHGKNDQKENNESNFNQNQPSEANDNHSPINLEEKQESPWPSENVHPSKDEGASGPTEQHSTSDSINLPSQKEGSNSINNNDGDVSLYFQVVV